MRKRWVQGLGTPWTRRVGSWARAGAALGQVVGTLKAQPLARERQGAWAGTWVGDVSESECEKVCQCMRKYVRGSVVNVQSVCG